jgi:hypothetical protein
MDYKKNSRIVESTNQALEDQAKYIAEQKPVERIKETVVLILRVFPLDDKRPNATRIYIDKA